MHLEKPLLATPPESELGYRQGIIVDYDVLTGSNTVDVGGSQLTDLPILSGIEGTSLESGDIVGLLRFKTQYFILGRVVTPNSESFNDVTLDVRGPSGDRITIGNGIISFYDTTESEFVDSTINGSAGDLVLSSNLGNVKIFPHLTTVNPANTLIQASDGKIYRSTSSARYKKDIEDANIDVEDILKLRPRRFLAKRDDDNKPRGIKQIGLIAEEVHDAGLEFLVQYNENDQPESVDYERLAVLQQIVIKSLYDQLQDHEHRIQQLEGGV